MEHEEIAQHFYDLVGHFIDGLRKRENLSVASMLGLQIVINDPEFRQMYENMMTNLIKLSERIDYTEGTMITNHDVESLIEQPVAWLEQEINAGFPTMYESSVVALWSAFESFNHLVLSDWIEIFPQARDNDGVRDFEKKKKLRDYESLSEDDKETYIKKAIFEYKSMPGVFQYDDIFVLFGLKGEVKTRTADLIRELEEFRHVIVHKGGKVDKKLIERNPSLRLPLGTPITISEERYVLYSHSIQDYAFELLRRIYIYLGREYEAQPHITGWKNFLREIHGTWE